MAKRQEQPEGRKRRTREHIIADLSVNYLERKVLECGFVLERRVHDYGVDATFLTFDEGGELENGFIEIQLKATDRLRVSAGGKSISVTISVRDLKSWMFAPVLVLLVIYDASKNRAYWLDIQKQELDLDTRQTINLHIPMRNRVNSKWVLAWRDLKNREFRAWQDWKFDHED